MNFAPYKYLPGLMLLLCSASMIFAQDGIVLTGPILSETELAKTETGSGVADKQVETDFRLEVSEFEMVPKNGQSETLTLVKIYDMKQPLGNSYILHAKGRNKATVIDPGYNGPAIARYLETENLTPDAILLTNGSFYRIASNAQFKEQWPKIAIGISEKDAAMLSDPKANQSESFGGITSPEPTIRFQGGERIETSSFISWQVLDTPGFTPGSLSYQLDTKEKRLIFTGDFIYRDGIGGSQLPMGDSEAFDLSLQAFLEYAPAETLIYPGFGPNTTVGDFYNNVVKGGEDGINILAEGQTLSMPVTDTASAVTYQNQIVEVYPTTTYLYSDFAIPRYYSPYYSYYYRGDLFSWGLHAWSWLPVRRPPPPHHHHHLHGPPSYWHGPGYVGRPNRPPTPNRPPQPGPGMGNRPDRPGRPPQPNPGSTVRPDRPSRPNPGSTVRPDRPSRPNPGSTVRPDRPSRPNPGSTVRPDRPSRPIPNPGLGSDSNRPNRPSQPGLGIGGDRPADRPTNRPADRPTIRPTDRPTERPTTRPTPGLNSNVIRPQRPAPGLGGGGSERPTRPTPAATGGSTRPSRPTPAATGGSTRPSRPAPAARSDGGSRPNRGGGEARPGGGSRENRPSRDGGERRSRD